MPNDFEWEAEDGTAFDEMVVQDGYHTDSRQRFRRPALILIAVALLVFSGVLAFRQLGQRVSNTTETLEEDVRFAHTLILSAARSADPEILANLLSGRQLEWTDAQLELLRQNLFYDRRPLGLEWQPEDTFEPVEISISPDLQEAEVVSLQSYLVEDGRDRGERVNLEHTSAYHRSGDRWLLSPPLFDFWGGKVSTRGRFLELSVLKRDETLGLRIAADLEATIGAACASLRDLECQPDTHVEVDLVADPTLLLEIAHPESRLQGSRYLKLPTPTLVGLPVDEPGYRVLYRGYAERVLSALIADLLDWSCCRQAHFYQALLDAQLFQLGLKHWPVTEEDYRQISNQSIGLEDFRRLWSQDDSAAEAPSGSETLLVYAFVEFLASDVTSVSVSQMQRSLASADSLDAWLANISSEGSSVDQDWDRFVQDRIAGSQVTD
jgi:hypothetical protein